MANRFPGLFRGPINHEGSTVINIQSTMAITMGSSLVVATNTQNGTLPLVGESTVVGSFQTYGIAVGGDTDGVFGDGSAATTDENRATNAAGQSVVVVTHGRTPARVEGRNTSGNVAIVLGDRLVQSAVAGVLQKATAGENVIALALQTVDSGVTDIIAVDVNQMGPF